MPETLTRISVSLPGSLLDRLDASLADRGVRNRSQAVGEMIRKYLVDHAVRLDERVVAGVITLVYANDRGDVRGRVRDIQHAFMIEVISSQHVFLEEERSLEALLVQGPGTRLQALADELTVLKGMETVSLAITAALLPPLHAGGAREGARKISGGRSAT